MIDKTMHYVSRIVIVWFGAAITYYSVMFIIKFDFMYATALLVQILMGLISLPVSFREILQSNASDKTEVEKRKTFVIHQ